MKLAIYDTFERKVTLTETLIWLAIFMAGLLLFLEAPGLFVQPALWLYDCVSPRASIFRGTFPFSVSFD